MWWKWKRRKNKAENGKQKKGVQADEEEKKTP
jgi:hypothetical protein